MKVWEYCGVRVFQGKASICGITAIKTFSFLWAGSMVDTGPSRLEKRFFSMLSNCRVDRVLLTHSHEDHSGNAARLQEERGIPVYVGTSSIEICKKDAGIPLYRRLVWGGRKKFDPAPLGEAIETGEGFLEVIATPGHSQDHVCFLDSKNGFVFTGDLFVTPRTRTIMRSESVPGIIRSIRKLLKEDFKTVFCAHAGVVENGRGMMEAKLEHLERLSEEVLRMHRSGMGVRQIERKFFKPQFLTFFSGSEWSPRHIITSIISGGN